MKTFDDDLRNALHEGPDDPSLRTAGEEGMIQQISATFRGRMRSWVLLTWFATLFWTAVCVWAAIAFFQSTETRDWIMYACIFLFGGMAVAMLKLWYLMELNRNTHTREIKRVELQLARLAQSRSL